MFELEEQITRWRAKMIRAGIHNLDVLDELESHLRENVNEQLKKGRPKDEAFRVTVSQLGDGKQLRREFAKANRFRFWMPRNNPVALNSLGVFFVLSGLNVLLSGSRFAFIMASDDGFNFSTELTLMVLLSYSCAAVEIGIGAGLLHLKNFWRWCAYFIATLQVLGSVDTLWVWAGKFGADLHGQYFTFMGLMVPMRVHFVTEAIQLPVMLWAIFYLSKPEVRELFSQKGKLKIVSGS